MARPVLDLTTIRIFSLAYLEASQHVPVFYTDVVIRILSIVGDRMFVSYDVAPTTRCRGRIVFVE